MVELKRGGEGKNNHERYLSFHVILLWRVGKSPYDESTPGVYANLQKRTGKTNKNRKTSISWLKTRSMKEVRKASWADDIARQCNDRLDETK